jgi:hypothetical protein
MQSPTTTNSSTSGASSQPIVGEPSSQGHSSQTAASSTRSHGSRTQTKWPEDKLIATGLDTNFWPTLDAVRDGFVLVCGLINRERVSINKTVDDISPIDDLDIPKNALLPSQLLAPVSSSEEEVVHGSEEEDGHDCEEEYVHDSKEDGREQDHWNSNGDKANQVHSDSRSPMLDTIDKLTEPTAYSLLDGTRINVEIALAKVFPFRKTCHSVPVQDGYVVVQPTYVWANAGHYPLHVPIDGGDVATLAEALVQRIQWPKDGIFIPPMTRHPNPKDATGSRGTT